MRPRRWLTVAAIGAATAATAALVVVATACLTSGCGTVGYYRQAVAGHVAMLRAARPTAEWTADAATSPALRARLELAQRIRAYASRELALPDNPSYTRYADLQRPSAVWNAVAAPELGLTLKTWCFPVVGCVGYRGYYDRAAADAEVAALRDAGWDAVVYPVPAYSTLGWSDWLGGDPLLNTFIGWPDAELARLVFHELAHHVVYVAGDTTFNESFATAVERIGVARWLRDEATPDARATWQVFDRRRRAFHAFALAWRERLQALYASGLPAATLRERKAAAFAAMRADYAVLKAERLDGFSGYDGWVAGANNASFAVLGAYHALAPGFERLFEDSGGDFARFYAAVRELAGKRADERRAALATPDPR